MCRHVVTFTEYSCGHQYPQHRERVDCNRTWCALSARHDTGEHDHARCATELNPDLNIVLPGYLFQHPCNLCLDGPASPGIGVHAIHTEQNGIPSDDDDEVSSNESLEFSLEDSENEVEVEA